MRWKIYPDVGDGKPDLVHTPGMKTIEEVAKFLGVSPKNKMKTLALMATDAEGGKTATTSPVVAFLRGDHQLNEAKLSGAIGTTDFRPMHPEEIEAVFGSPAGFLGPIGIGKLRRTRASRPRCWWSARCWAART